MKWEYLPNTFHWPVVMESVSQTNKPLEYEGCVFFLRTTWLTVEQIVCNTDKL